MGERLGLECSWLFQPSRVRQGGKVQKLFPGLVVDEKGETILAAEVGYLVPGIEAQNFSEFRHCQIFWRRLFCSPLAVSTMDRIDDDMADFVEPYLGGAGHQVRDRRGPDQLPECLPILLSFAEPATPRKDEFAGFVDFHCYPESGHSSQGVGEVLHLVLDKLVSSISGDDESISLKLNFVRGGYALLPIVYITLFQ
jgi:hypothetical protein